MWKKRKKKVLTMRILSNLRVEGLQKTNNVHETETKLHLSLFFYRFTHFDWQRTDFTTFSTLFHHSRLILNLRLCHLIYFHVDHEILSSFFLNFCVSLIINFWSRAAVAAKLTLNVHRFLGSPFGDWSPADSQDSHSLHRNYSWVGQHSGDVHFHRS